MMDKVHIVFDRYDIPNSLREATRIQRQGMQTPVEYHITNTTNVAKISQAKLLSHPKTKRQLTSYLGQALLDDASSNGRHVVVAWGTRCKARFSDKAYMSSEQVEADSKLLLHVKDAVDCIATNIHIFSPDTDVLILAIRRYPELCLDTNFVTGVGEHQRTIIIGDIYSALGPSIAAALPGLHSLSGCDNTGCFAEKAKVSFWNIFCQANNSMISALGALGTSSGLSDENCAAQGFHLQSLYYTDIHLKGITAQVVDVYEEESRVG